MSKHELLLVAKADKDIISNDRLSERIIEISVTAPSSKKEQTRKPLNLALVIDKSGSMQGPKLAQAKNAALHAIELLSSKDQLAVVAFDSNVDVLIPAGPMNEDYKQFARTRISSIEAGSNTNLSGGWLTGCDQIANFPIEGALNRALLLTDGLANNGVVEPEELALHAQQLNERGISTTTFGVGADYNEFLLELMANNGGGNYYFIENAEEIPELFQLELEELTTITAANTKVKISLPDGVKVRHLGNWKTLVSSEESLIALGDIPSSQERKAYCLLYFPGETKRKDITVDIHVNAIGEDGKPLENATKLDFIYEAWQLVEYEIPDIYVRDEAAKVIVSDEARKALALEREGNFEEAKKILDEVLSVYGDFLSSAVRREYDDLRNRIEFGLNPLMRKMMHSSSYTSSRSMPRRQPREPKKPQT